MHDHAVRVLVAGASGAVGRPCVAALRAAGHEPVAVGRRPVEGVETLVADVIGDPLEPVLQDAGVQALVVQLTSLPAKLGPGARRGFPANDAVRSVGVPRLVDAALAAGVQRVVLQSMTALARPVDAAPPLVRRAADAVATAERAVVRAEEGVVLRHGLLTGPGTWYAAGGSYALLARLGALPLVGDGSARASYLHVEDAAAAAVHALGVPPGTYEIGEPVAAGDFWPAFAAAVGARRPRALPRRLLRLTAGSYAEWFAATDLATSGAPPLPGWQPARGWQEGLPGR